MTIKEECAACAGTEGIVPDASFRMSDQDGWETIVFCSLCKYSRIPIPFPCLFDIIPDWTNRTGSNPEDIEGYRFMMKGQGGSRWGGRTSDA